MEAPATSRQSVRFGEFELDFRSEELRKHGDKVKLQGQPIKILAILLAQPGELVTREALGKELWPGDTFVEPQPITLRVGTSSFGETGLVDQAEIIPTVMPAEVQRRFGMVPGS